jgi:hypothetical protein
MNFCCACLLCALAIATGSVDFATERVAEPCAIALPCEARLPLADLPEQPHPSPVSPTLGARWTAETSVTVNAAHPVVWSPDNAGH